VASSSANDTERSSLLLKERTRAVFRHLPKALAGDEEAIHQVRVAGRRLRVALPLLARKPRGRRVRRALGLLRALTRTAGSSRDLDVGLELLLARLGGLEHTPERSALRGRLRAARRRSRTRLAEALMDLEIAQLRRDLRVILARTGTDVFSAFARLRHARELGAETLVGGFEALGERYDAEALHRLRRQARRLRYAAEAGDALRGVESEAPKLFKSLQEQLGRVHDSHVIATWLGRQAARARPGRESLAAEARALEQSFVEESRAHHRALLEGNAVEVARRALAAMAPARSAA
jgi:CHAD domain-containing protein